MEQGLETGRGPTVATVVTVPKEVVVTVDDVHDVALGAVEVEIAVSANPLKDPEQSLVSTYSEVDVVEAGRGIGVIEACRDVGDRESGRVCDVTGTGRGVTGACPETTVVKLPGKLVSQSSPSVCCGLLVGNGASVDESRETGCCSVGPCSSDAEPRGESKTEEEASPEQGHTVACVGAEMLEAPTPTGDVRGRDEVQFAWTALAS